MKVRPFKVVNCLSQGFAVARPPENPASGVDLEMIQWGMAADKAMALAKRWNDEAEEISDGHRPPLHRRD